MKFYVAWGEQSKSYLSYSRKISGQVIINSSRLKTLCRFLPIEKDFLYKGVIYHWDGENLWLQGKFKCENPDYFRECWGIDDPWGYKKAPVECRTKCLIQRITQSLFTYLAKKAKESSGFSCTPEKEERAKPDDSLHSPASAEAEEREQQQSHSDCSKAEAEGTEDALETLQSDAQSSSESAEYSSGEDTQRQEGEGSAEAPDAESPGSNSAIEEIDALKILEEILSEGTEEESCQVRSSSDSTEADGSPASAEAGAGKEKDSSLDSRSAGASESRQQESQKKDEPGRGSSPDEEVLSDEERASKILEEFISEDKTTDSLDISSSESKSLWEISYNPKEDQHSYGGGGGQAGALTAKDSSTASEKEVLYLLRRFFSEIEDLFRKKEGFDRWDAKKVIRSLTMEPGELPKAKFSRQKSRKISLWVDVSGSVSHLTKFIITLITAACKDNDVQVVIGSEAHPEKVLPRTFIHQDKDWWDIRGMWEAEYIYDFHLQVKKFLKDNSLPAGSTIVIWSDYMDINTTDLKELSRLLKPYKVVWLCSHNGKDPDYRGNESFKIERFAKKEGHLFLWGIDSLQGIKKAIKQLNIRRYRR